MRGIGADGRIGRTLRLNPNAWEQLKVFTAKEHKDKPAAFLSRQRL